MPEVSNKLGVLASTMQRLAPSNESSSTGCLTLWTTNAVVTPKQVEDTMS